MAKINTEQTNIFTLFGITDEVEEKKRQLEDARIKQQQEIAQRAEKMKQNAESTSKSTAPAKKKEEPFEVNMVTFIYHLGERIPVTAYFTPEEIESGIPTAKKDQEQVEYKKITGEDVRKRLEKDYPDLVAAYTEMVFIKQKNMVMAVPKAKKKGLNQDCTQKSSASAEGFVVSKKIPFPILQDFIALSKRIYGEHGTELHGDIYIDLDKELFFLDIPQQIALRETVERIEEPHITALKLMDIRFIKVMEIHSHHEWAPIPSMTDNESERQGNMLYAIVGCLNQFFPQVTARYFDTKDQRHININPSMIFENPFDSTPNEYDMSVVEVHTRG
ncbi:hypothetical protein [Sutcliffiella cohnii]|uniref:hypothetical protein n=1 Tax=Sutcliffiella cohnii TaxID=33932 RepID=UPI0008336FE3|nr:hypothetical protein [Sutcliffiella cohnii]